MSENPKPSEVVTIFDHLVAFRAVARKELPAILFRERLLPRLGKTRGFWVW